MLIAIGSTNPVKQAAAETVLNRVFTDVRFQAIAVPSGVSAQPWGDAETRQGAYTRAKAALDASDAEFGIGLEGGIIDTEFGMMTNAWCAVMNRSGQVGIGGGSHCLLPSSIAEVLREGQMELGTAMDRLIGEDNTKQKQGAIGILTGGLLSRQAAYEVIIQLAVAPFRQPDLYGDHAI